MHSEKRKTFECLTCDRSFFFQSDLNYHEKTVHGDKNLFKCTDCEKIYSTKKLLKNYHQFVHLKLNKYRRKECGLSFGMSITLYRHKKKVIY